MPSKPLSTLSLPLNFDRRQDVTILTRLAKGRQFAFLLWLEWGNERVAWRPIKATDPDAIDWPEEDLTFVIESFVGWEGEPGDFIKMGIRAGMLNVEKRGEALGLELTDFVTYNAQLDPYHQTRGAKGGAKRGVNRARKEAATLARQQVRLEATRQDELILPDGMTRDQREEAIALVMRIDRALGQPTRKDFGNDLVEDAAAAIQQCSEETIDEILVWLVGQRDNPQVVKETPRVLRDWHKLVDQVAPPSTSE